MHFALHCREINFQNRQNDNRPSFFRMEQVVWVPEPKEGFVLATIVDLGMDEVTVQPLGTSKARFALPLDRIYTADAHFDNKDVDDNCKHMVVVFL